ncbi:MAG: glycosyltransferase family 1 protein [Bacteroidota bacterium]
MAGRQQVYINGRFLCQKTTGVQKYALGIAVALQKQHPDIIVLAPKGSVDCRGLTVQKRGWGKGFFWEQLWLPWFMWLHKGSLFLNFCNTAPLLLKRQIVTIHDLAFLKNKEWFNAFFRIWYKFLIPRLCKRSLAIAAVTEVIRKEISEVYSLPSEKITVVPNGLPDMDYEEQSPYDFSYLLLTGIYNPRKNASFVISQLPEIKKKNYHIVGTGVDAGIYGKEEFVQNEYLHVMGFVDDTTYYTLLKHAAALVFPSGYEGFGIPVLEALTLGVAVVVPDIPVYRESFGELPIYYTPDDVASFLQSLDRINVHKPATNELLYLENKFNFDKSAEILSGVLQKYQDINITNHITD